MLFGARLFSRVVSRNSASIRCSAFLLSLLSIAGCATRPTPATPPSVPFRFGADTFGYANELVWEYEFDQEGKQTVHRRRQPSPEYTHHCFVMARAAAQFHLHARFDPGAAAVSDKEYARLIRQIVQRNPRRRSSAAAAIVIPGYTNLNDLSTNRASVLQKNCGSWWQSYFQRGHWRMILPLGRNHQERTAETVRADLEAAIPRVVHLVRFPSLAINHAVLLYDFEAHDNTVTFKAYDPNDPASPRALEFCRDCRRFYWPRTDYFRGGRVDVYRIYHEWKY